MSTEGNKLVAEFMGYELKQGKELAKYYAGGNTWYYVGENFTTTEGEWQPEANWNHLMPVVEKIHDECKLYSYGLSFFEGLTIFSTINQVWEAVVQFIQWYNQSQ